MEGSGTFDDPPGALDGQPLSDIATAKERLNLLVESANFKVDTSVSPLRYFNSAKQLFETGKYEALHENNQKGYMLIMRFLELYITRLPRHPKYNLVGDDKKREVNKILKEALKLGEELKVKVLRELEDEREQEMARQAYLKQKYAAFAQPKIDGVVQQIANFNNALPSAPHYTDLRVSWPQQNSQLENYDGGTVDWSAPPPPYPGTHPSFDRSLKPSALVAPPRSSKLNNERRGPPPSPAGILRAVRIPADLVEQFTQAARENTEKKNIETCGNLWGRRQ